MRRRRLASLLTSLSLAGAPLGYASVDPSALLEAPSGTEARQATAPGIASQPADNGFQIGLGWAERSDAHLKLAIERRIAGISPHWGEIALGVQSELGPQLLGMGAELTWSKRWKLLPHLVPRIGYQWGHQWNSQGSAWRWGPTVGLGVLLDHVDEDSAADFYLRTAVLRTFLLGEATFTTAEWAGSLSLRFEY